jgi:phage terminase large subunit-like protein
MPAAKNKSKASRGAGPTAPPGPTPAANPSPAVVAENARLRGIVEKYIRDVDAGAVVAGDLVIRAVRRHLWDLGHRNDLRHRFDEASACRVIRYFALLKHWRGELVGQPFILAPWQMFIVWVLFGWKRSDGTRRFRIAYVMVAKKNGKSPFIAGIGLYLLTSDGEAGADIYSAATKKDQARIIVTEAAMLRKKSPSRHLLGLICSPELKGRNGGGKFVNNIAYVDGASKIEVLSKDSDTQDGLNVYGGLVDEVHAHKDRSMWDQLIEAMGARRQPMLIGITTGGETTEGSIGVDLYERSKNALEGFDKPGGAQDDAFFGFVAAASEKDDPYSDETIMKANPNAGVSVKWSDLRESAQHAKENPSARPNYLRKRLNLWLQAETAWLNVDQWDACRATIPYTLDDLVDQGWECWGAMDLAAKIDLNSLALLFRRDNKYRLLIEYWMPKERAIERARKEPMFTPWIDQARPGGPLIRTTPGDIADYDFIEAEIVRIGKLVSVNSISADPWNFGQIGVHVRDKHGFTVKEFHQGVASFNDPCREWERLILGKLIEHDGNPVTRWMIGNVAVKTDANGNIQPVKSDHKKTKKQIDGVVCAIMALGAAIEGDGSGDLDGIPFAVAGG